MPRDLLAQPRDLLDGTTPKKDYSNFDAAMIAAGRTADKLWQGGKELYYGATGNDAQLERLRKIESGKDAAMSKIEESHPISTAAGSALPYFAVPFGGAARFTGQALSKVPGMAKAGQTVANSGLADSVLTGAGLSGLEYGATAGEGALMGGAGYTAGRALLGAGARLNPLQKSGEKLGMRLTPGQRTGSKALQQIEASLDSMPFTASAGGKIKDINQSVVNRATGKAIGEQAEKITPEVLDAADNRIGDIFDSVAHNKPIKTDDIVDDVLKASDEVDDLLPDNMSIIDDKLVKRLLRYADKGTATGKELRAMSSKLGKKAHKMMRTDPDAGWGLYLVKDGVDNRIANSLSGEQLASYNAARGQYRNLMMLKSKVANFREDGNVASRTMGNTLKQKDFKGYSQGRNKSDMYEALRFANAHPNIVGDSGTATRGVLPLLLAGSMGNADATTGEVVKNLAGGLLGGNLAARYYYADPLRNGILPNVGKRLSDPTKRLISQGVGRGLLAY